MKSNKFTRRRLLYIAVVVVLLLFCIAAVGIVVSQRTADAPAQTNKTKDGSSKQAEPKPKPKEAYEGQIVTVGNSFAVKAPGGWKASISTDPTFLAIMFARPSMLESLVYDASKPAAIDNDGIPAWSGLTEHFYIRATTPEQRFNPAQHQEVTSEQFTFSDGTKGTRYLVIKHAAEAAAWGGLLKDTEWCGRTYVYEKDGQVIEAHLALYPSSKVDVPFYENIVRSIRLN